MNRLQKVLITSVVALYGLGMAHSLYAASAEPNKRRGKVYFRMVCTSCHKAEAGRAIAPNSRTMAQWRVYFKNNVHASKKKFKQPERNKVSYFVSTKYRASIKDTNKAAKRFLALPNQQLYADVREFVVNGAKDSDTPARCN